MATSLVSMWFNCEESFVAAMGEYFENCNQAPMISQQQSVPEPDVQEVDAAQFAPTNQGKKKGTYNGARPSTPMRTR
jgi:hypothetical protein